MGEEPHPVGLGPLPLQELPQQPLHLAVSGVGALHRLLCVESIERRSECRLRGEKEAGAATAGFVQTDGGRRK